jgi:hypothetical protein
MSPTLPGTAVPGYRLFRPYGTELRHLFMALQAEEKFKNRQDKQGLKPNFFRRFGPTKEAAEECWFGEESSPQRLL